MLLYLYLVYFNSTCCAVHIYNIYENKYIGMVMFVDNVCAFEAIIKLWFGHAQQRFFYHAFYYYNTIRSILRILRKFLSTGGYLKNHL